MKDVNKKYKGKYTYVRLSSDIHSVSDIKSLINQYPFEYFAISVWNSVQFFRSGSDTSSGIR